MYHAHFGMHTDPFPLSPRLAFVFQSRAFGETMAHLVFGVEQEEDIVLITGGIGTGKTLALRSLVAQLPAYLRPVEVGVTKMTFAELLKYLLLELDVEVTGQMDVPEMLQRLKSHLVAVQKKQEKLLLIVDEAQHLDVETLEGLRLLINLSPPERQGLQLILSGQPGLEAKIARPELAQLDQRIRVRYRLQTLTRQELEAYIDHRTRVAGCPQPLFKKGALDRIYEFSRGIPRVVNILASRALLAAFVAGKSKVEPEHVKEEDLPTVAEGEPLEPPDRRARPVPRRETAAAPPPPPPPAPEPAAATPPEADSYDPLPPRTRGHRHEEKRRGRGWIWAALVIVVLLGLGIWQGPALLQRGQEAAPEAAMTPPPPAPSTEPVEPVEQEPPGAAGEVATTATEPEANPPAATQAPPPQTAAVPRLAVHVASFRDGARAERFLGTLRDAGYPALMEQTTVDGEVWVRVLVGPFGDRAAAAQAETQLRGRGVVGWSHLVTVEG